MSITERARLLSKLQEIYLRNDITSPLTYARVSAAEGPSHTATSVQTPQPEAKLLVR